MEREEVKEYFIFYRKSSHFIFFMAVFTSEYILSIYFCCLLVVVFVYSLSVPTGLSPVVISLGTEALLRSFTAVFSAPKIHNRHSTVFE